MEANFSSLDQAERIAERMDKKYPDQIFIPYIDLNENAMVEKSTRIMADLEETVFDPEER